MATGRRGLKRKSKDSIHEITENNSLNDEKDNQECLPNKILKVDTKNKPQAVSTPNLKHSLRSNKKTPQEDTSEHSDKNMQKKDIENIIEIEESDKETDFSVEIIEKTIPFIDLCESTDSTLIDKKSDEEGEIESLKVIDETPTSPENNTLIASFLTVDEVNETTEESDDVFINVKFHKDAFELYKTKFLNFFKTFPEFELNTTDDDCSIKIIKKSTIDEEELKTPKKKHKKKKPKKELFVLDTNPSLNDSSNVRYSRICSIEETANVSLNEKSIPSAQTCFNCGAHHSLKDCTQPKDFVKINAARQKFNKSKVARYHVEEEQKFAHIKPGQISENLRNALGLKKSELPSYIYGMRALGYPPGWLEEAKQTNSNLRMFDIDGGKVKGAKEKRKKGLDPTKIIEYPGFNAPFSKSFHDDYRKYNVPPYSKDLNKENMLKHFEKLCEQEIESETSDMDLDEVVETADKTIKAKEKVLEISHADSPSLVDLEQKKKELIDQINASNFNQKTNSESSGYASNSQTDESENSNSNAEPSLIVLKSSALGTPILKSSSCYSRLPNPDNFSVGVSPIIEFENLPNSTGKYEKMTEVLSKVRTTLKNLDPDK